MAYFVYCRDRPGSLELRSRLVEEHWSFMDGYAEAMIARGPTMAADGTTPTGSLHLVELPDADAVRVFAFDEPNYRAGVYEEVLVRRWRNVLGRTMWDFVGPVPGELRFLIIGSGRPEPIATADELPGYLANGGYADRLIAYGPLLSDDGSAWTGTAILAELPDRATAEALLANSPYRYDTIEVHDWCFGGRR